MENEKLEKKIKSLNKIRERIKFIRGLLFIGWMGTFIFMLWGDAILGLKISLTFLFLMAMFWIFLKSAENVMKEAEKKENDPFERWKAEKSSPKFKQKLNKILEERENESN